MLHGHLMKTSLHVDTQSIKLVSCNVVAPGKAMYSYAQNSAIYVH